MGAAPKRIALGSGNIYYTEFSGTLPEISTLKSEENRLGYIQGGATLEYKPTFYTAKDDMGYVSTTILTDEEVSLKTGLLTFSPDTMKILCETGRASAGSHSEKILKIGGLANASGKSYVIVFNHPDKVQGDIDVVIVGKNTEGFSLAFTKEKETVIDAVFSAKPQDDEGTLVQYIEYAAA